MPDPFAHLPASLTDFEEPTMNMHPIYRARRLRSASLAALLLAVVAFGKFLTTGMHGWWLLALMLYCVAIAFGVMLRRAEGGVA